MLVEREDELHTLDDALAACAGGWGQLVIISGGVASGKTELLHSFLARAAERRAVLLTATGSQAEGELRFGTLRQLVRSSTLPEGVAEELAGALHEVAVAADGRSASDAIEQWSAPVLDDVCATLVKLGQDGRPVVIAIDDVQFADRHSLNAVLYLQRRIRFARVLLVLAERTLVDPGYDAFRAEVTRQPNTTHLQLAPLTPTAVGALLPDRAGPSLAARYHALTGGNPLLVNGLMSDNTTSADDEVTVGRGFRHAVTACLHRCDRLALDVMRWLAVLTDNGLCFLDTVLDIAPAALEQVVRELELAGLLHDGARFRHPVAHAAVLESIAPTDRAQMHLRAAELLHGHDGKAMEIADHLAVADSFGATVRGSWAVTVLRHAGQHDLINGRVEAATQRLDLAVRSSVSDADRAAVSSLLLRVEWHRKPSAAARHLAVLGTASADGRLPMDDVLDLAKFLLWYGHIDELAATLRALADSMAIEPMSLGHVSLALRWLAFLCPSAADGLPMLHVLPSKLPHSPWSVAVEMLDNIRLNGPREQIIDTAVQLLSNNRISEHTFDLQVSALVALLYVDAHEQTEQFCESLLADAATRSSNSWGGLFRAIQSATMIRRGELAAAAELAATAYDMLSPQGWGVAIGVPLSMRIAAATRMDLHDTAAALLSLPVPESMFRTQFGLLYLYERGHHYLATDRPHLALTDFQRCGELLRSWNTDLTTVVPWRVGMAEAHRMLGNLASARELVTEQLESLSPGDARNRGIALRVLGTASGPDRQVRLLQESVDLLDASGDRFETARSLLELSYAHHAVGEHDEARAAGRRGALLLAETSGERGRGSTLTAVVGGQRRPSAGQPLSVRMLGSLSDAELRVAALAALGHTNREIGDRLYITVSTVEQHLTRVYRKLKVSRRQDLPADLRHHEPALAERSCS